MQLDKEEHRAFLINMIDNASASGSVAQLEIFLLRAHEVREAIAQATLGRATESREDRWADLVPNPVASPNIGRWPAGARTQP
jgi:transcriptional regulator of nitric oxide reductase